jgi:hypothetical protein
MGLNTTIAMPACGTPITMPDGRLTDPWYRLLLALVARTGGAQGVSAGTVAAAVANGRFVVESSSPDLPAALQLVASAPLELAVGQGTLTISLSIPLPLADGGTGAEDAAGARQNLGLGSIATQSADAVSIGGGAIDGTDVGDQTPAKGTFSHLTNGDAVLMHMSVPLPNGAGAAAGTLTNAPVAGNPTKWCPFDDGGTIRYFPTWSE